MFKGARSKNMVHFSDIIHNKSFSLNLTAWEIVKSVKKYGKNESISKISTLFEITEENAREDIENVLNQIKTYGLDLKDFPDNVTDIKYAPLITELDVTPRCNSNCIYCLASERMKDKVELSTKQIYEIIDDLHKLGCWSLTLSGGEPTLREDLFELLDYIQKKDIIPSVFSNAMNIDKGMAEKFAKYNPFLIQVSVDSAIPERHDLQRGEKGAFQKTINGIKNLLEKNIHVEVSTIITPLNIDDLETTASFLHKLGIKHVRLGPAVILGRATKNEEKLSLSNDQLQELGKRIANLNEKFAGEIVFSKSPHMVTFTGEPSELKRPLHSCAIGKYNLYISSNGLVYPCMLLTNSEFVFGDVKKNGLTEIWDNSEKIKELRKFSISDIKKCNNCEFKKICNGGCRGTAYLAFNSITAPDPVFCSYFGTPITDEEIQKYNLK